MAQYTVKLPDGTTLKLEGPDGASDEQVIAQAQKMIATERPKANYSKPVMATPAWEQRRSLSDLVTGQQPSKVEPIGGYGMTDAAIHSATLGADSAVLGVGGGIANAITAPFSDKVDFDPIGAFNRTRQGSLDAADEYSAKHPIGSAGGGLLGAFIGAPGQALKAVAEPAAGFLSRLLKSAGVGGASGAIAAANSSRNWRDVPGNLAAGGAAGATLGAALPTAGAVLKPVINAGKIAFTKGQGLAVERVANALGSDMVTPSQAGSFMDEAASLGVPRVLGDAGENTARLLGNAARQPGEGRTMARTFLKDRQRSQGERLQNAITRDLGPVGGVQDMAETISKQGSARARPLYEQSYEAGPVADPAIAQIMQHPEMQDAFARAQALHQNDAALARARGEPVPPPLSTDPAAPHVRTIDYIKRGLDRKISSAYEGDSQAKMNLPFLKEARKLLLERTDEAVPAYAQARRSFAGSAQDRDALELGQKMVHASEADIAHATAKMGESEKAQFALGMRSKLSENLAKKTDGSNKVDYLSNSPQRRSVLQQVAGPDANLERFQNTLGHEDAAQQTYGIAMNGSPTAINLADDAINADAGVAQDVLGRFMRGSRNGLWSGITNAAAPLLDAARFGTGSTGDRVRQEIAALLTEKDPRAFQAVLEELSAQKAARRVKAGRLGLQASNVLGTTAGGYIPSIGQ